MGPGIPTRPYNAINGQELIKIVQDLVAQTLEDSGEFSIAFAFPIIKNLKFELSFDYFPSFESPHKVIRAAIAGPPPPSNAGDSVRVSVEGGLKEIGETVPPDQVRINHGLGVPTPVKDAAAILVDKLIRSGGAPPETEPTK